MFHLIQNGRNILVKTNNMNQVFGTQYTKCGQAMIEYVVVAGMLLASLAILLLFLQTFQEYGCRILEMVASDYP